MSPDAATKTAGATGASIRTAPIAGPACGIVFRLSVPVYLAARALDRWLPRALASGRIPGLAYTRLESRLPGPEWLRLLPALSGICGSDLALLTGRSSPALSPFSSFPAVLGHETVATVDAVGDAVTHVKPGDRVVVDPVISCAVRGLEPCASCLDGQPALCLRTVDGALSPGMLMGFCRDAPGAWAEETLAHRSQVYLVPETIPDEAAVLVEPLSVGLHAVLKLPPEAQHRVLIVGAGTIGLCALAALRLLAIGCHVTVLARHAFQADMAAALGADEVVREGRDAGGGGDSAGSAAVRLAGARRHQPALGRPVYTGGFDWVYDCVGSQRSLDDSLRVAGPRGRVVVAGCPGKISHLDWSFVWARELHVTGSYVYGREPAVEGAPHTFELALRLLDEQPDYPLARLVTHRFPLSRRREALGTSLRRGNSGAIKVVFDCQADRRTDGHHQTAGSPVTP